MIHNRYGCKEHTSLMEILLYISYNICFLIFFFKFYLNIFGNINDSKLGTDNYFGWILHVNYEIKRSSLERN